MLLMDELFGALDHQTRELMQELLLGIWESEKKTVLFVTTTLTRQCSWVVVSW